MRALRSHILAGAALGPWGDEWPYAEQLWPKIPDDSLTIVDRNFLAAHLLVGIESGGANRHWLTRATSRSYARAKLEAVPKVWTMRAIHYRRPGFKPQTLLTSLLDPKQFPADEIRALYHERWELELGYDEVKTDMLDRQEATRSKTVKGVLQELWAIALA